MSWQDVLSKYVAMGCDQRAIWFGMLWRQLETVKSYVKNSGYVDKTDLEILLEMKKEKPKDTETGDE